MLSESLVSACFDVCVSTPNSYPKSRELFSSIYNIFDYYIRNTPEEKRPLNARTKIEFVLYLSRFRVKKPEDYSIEKVKDLIVDGKYNDLISLLKVKEEYTQPDKLNDFLTNTIIPKRKSSHLGTSIPDIKQAIEDYENGAFEDLNDLLQKFENIINKTSSGLKELNRVESISKASCLDLFNDDFSDVLERYRQQCKTDTIKSGFDVIDDSLPFGGFESGRIYIFGGETGVGKSIMLLNILSNTIKHAAENSNSKNENNKKSVHIYITAENLIDESLIRYYCTSTGRPHCDVIKRIKEDPTFDPKKEIIHDLNRANTNILFFYVPARVVTLSEIEALIDDSVQKYDVRSVYIDYLDLVRSGTPKLELRHELGEVTSGFKRLAILNNIPVITATQLNRSGYNNSKATITSMSESMNKANDADFISFLQRTDEDISRFSNSMGEEIFATKVRISVLKNRGGKTGSHEELLLEKTINGMDVFNYRFSEVPQYKEISIDGVVTNEFDAII